MHKAGAGALKSFLKYRINTVPSGCPFISTLINGLEYGILEMKDFPDENRRQAFPFSPVFRMRKAEARLSFHPSNTRIGRRT